MDKKPVINVMIDLETLGLKPGCAIVAIGASMFSTSDNSFFYSNISKYSNSVAGLTLDPSTLAWWNLQSKEAQELSLYGSDILQETLRQFAEWLKEIEDGKFEVRVWGNAASFDLKILEAAYAACGIPVPWKYYNEMCFRTLKNLGLVVEPEFAGVKHYALADARHQARWAEKILEKIEYLYE
jgi:hypothetical protein